MPTPLPQSTAMFHYVQLWNKYMIIYMKLHRWVVWPMSKMQIVEILRQFFIQSGPWRQIVYLGIICLQCWFMHHLGTCLKADYVPVCQFGVSINCVQCTDKCPYLQSRSMTKWPHFCRKRRMELCVVWHLWMLLPLVPAMLGGGCKFSPGGFC